MSKILKTIGRNIRCYRIKKKFTQYQLAERAGFHRNYISHIENARTNMYLTNLAKIAKALGVRSSDLVKQLKHRP